VRALAEARGLPSLASALGDLHPQPPPTKPASETLEAALAEMARRGCAPELVATVLQQFAGRPLERGLVAWDVLASTLFLPSESAYRDELMATARPLGTLLPRAGRRGIGSVELTAALALATPAFATASDDALADALATHSLGAYETLRERGAAGLLRRQQSLVDRTRLFAHLLHLARLETTASFYLRYLWQTLAWPAALPDYCEVRLDCGQASPPPGAALDGDLAGYVAARGAIVDGTSRAYLDRVIAAHGNRFWAMRVDAVAKTDPRTRLAEGEIGSMYSSLSFPYDVVDKISEAHPTWRWGARVRAAVRSRMGDSRALALVNDYLARFGSDDDIFGAVFDHDFTGSRRAELRNRAAAETAAAPHVAANWSALARLTLLDPRPALDEIAARLALRL
jgi:hypothetical protein